jgi:nucleotide-binding universal stress UspA family protein
MYRTIIVPLDGSPLAEQALPAATMLASRGGAKVALIRVHNSYPLEPLAAALEAPNDARWNEILRADENEYLARIALRIETEVGRVVSTALLDGGIMEGICAFVGTVPAPLIVMSTHGLSGFSRMWLGSVADGVVRHTTAPVLLIRGDEKSPPQPEDRTQGFQNIVVPVDGSPFAEQVLEHAVELAHITHARVLLLEIVRPLRPPIYASVPEYPMQLTPEEFIEQTTQELVARAEGYVSKLAARLRAAHAPLDIRAEVRTANEAAGVIIETAKRRGADLIAMATHGRGVSRLVVGSVADKVLRGGPGALLLIRPRPD